MKRSTEAIAAVAAAREAVSIISDSPGRWLVSYHDRETSQWVETEPMKREEAQKFAGRLRILTAAEELGLPQDQAEALAARYMENGGAYDQYIYGQR